MKTYLVGGLLTLTAMTAPTLMPTAAAQTQSARQTQRVTGRVYDAMGPLVGATVMERGSSSNGVVTDIDGNFSLSVAKDAVLVISFIGYEPQEVPASTSPIRVTLTEERQAIDEVVVIGYGTQRKENVTGSVANIGGDRLNQVVATNAAYSLQGRIAGVNMQQTSSQPGAEMQIRIRGQRSLNASNDPLIVLDGIPFMGSLSDINPSDIKSMDILKDASATAIYGSRGANGVIIIQTVKGAQGSPARVTYNAYAGFKKVFHKYPMMGAAKYQAMRDYAGLYTNTLDEVEGVDTDWQDLFYKTGFTQSHDITVTGGTTDGSYSLGGGYYHDESVVPTQGFTRYSLHANYDQAIGKYFRFGLSSTTNFRETTGSNVGLYGVLSKTPMIDPYDSEGNLKRAVNMPLDNGQYIWTKERLEDLDDQYLNQSRAFGSYNTLFAEVKCPWVEGLSYRANVGLNFKVGKTGSFTGTGIGSSNAAEPNSASVLESQTRNWTLENILSYDHQWDKHRLSLTALYSAEETRYERIRISGRSIPADEFQYYQLGAAESDLNVDASPGNYWQSGLMSWMGRAIYTYDDKYMLSVALRQDASSRLAKGHQRHTYPAVSVGWNMANEQWMGNVAWIDRLKLRVGYGETSNQSIDPYSTLGALSTNYYNYGSNMATGYYVSTLPNPNLGWEYSTTWNYGIDFSVLDSRLYGTIEYYVQHTNDLLLSVKLPTPSGVSSYMANVGETENKGFELSLNGVILDNLNGWSWDMGVNLYANRNKLVALASGAKEDVENRWFVGHPIDVLYDYKKIGLWQQGEEDLLNQLEPGGNVGMIKVEYTGEYDAEGKPVRQINTDDRQVMDMEPDLMGGFNTTVSYRHWDLTVIGAFQIGGKLVSALHSSNGYLNMLNGRRGQIDVDYWTEDNPGAKYPRPGGLSDNDNPVYGSTLGYFDAGYLKVRTITLGYNFSHFKPLRDMGIDRLRVYASVQNPFVIFSDFTDECGLDPETNATSASSNSMSVTMEGYKGAHQIPVIGYNTPSTRNFLFGLNVTF